MRCKNHKEILRKEVEYVISKQSVKKRRKKKREENIASTDKKVGSSISFQSVVKEKRAGIEIL